jgi:hypothetical protein
MSRRSTRVVSVSSASNSRTTSKPKNSTLFRAYKSVFGPSKSKLANIARLRSVIEGCDEFLNNITDKNIPDVYGQIPTILNMRNENYDKLSDATRLTAEDIAANQAIHAKIKNYHANNRSRYTSYNYNLAGTRKRRKHRKHKKH